MLSSRRLPWKFNPCGYSGVSLGKVHAAIVRLDLRRLLRHVRVHGYPGDILVCKEGVAGVRDVVANQAAFPRLGQIFNLQEMGKEAGIGRIPKGGGEAATNAARRLAQKQGTEVLKNFVKLHVIPPL